MDRLTHSDTEVGQPVIMLVQVAFFMAFLLLAPPVVESLLPKCRNLYRSHENEVPSNQETYVDGDSVNS
jgi:hypothetical protein